MNPETDLVYYKDEKNGSFMSGGYKINSEMFGNMKPMFVMNDLYSEEDFEKQEKKNLKKENTNASKQKGGNGLLFSSIFKDMAVPAGLLYLQQTIDTDGKSLFIDDNSDDDDNDKNKRSKKNKILNLKKIKENEVVSDSLYDRLVDMVSPQNKKNYNRKSRKISNKKNDKNKQSGKNKKKINLQRKKTQKKRK